MNTVKNRIFRSWFQAAVALGLLMSAVPGRAFAGAPSNTLELGVELGYAQGFGPIAAGLPTLQGISTAGGALKLDAGWRIDPRWMVGAYAEGSLYGSGNVPGSDHATGLAAGLQGQFHVLPFEKYDPWVGVGFGWRGLWADRGNGTQSLQGLDLARVQVGVDYRLTDSFSLAPTVGVSLTQFLSQKPAGGSGFVDTTDRKLNTFVFAGVGGRFDL